MRAKYEVDLEQAVAALPSDQKVCGKLNFGCASSKRPLHPLVPKLIVAGQVHPP